MPFIDDILKYKSLSIIGMAKNTGKTECLNYIIRRLKDYRKKLAITSIGIDGESIDQVTNTHKPEIEIPENTIFVTSEKHYKEKKIIAEILDVSERTTSLGRLITARSKNSGKLIFSGPSSTQWLKEIIDKMPYYGAEITLVDGALSRKSLASPSITDSMILTTGAALSANIPTLVKQTKFTYTLINLDKFDSILNDKLIKIDKGLWAIDKENNLYDLQIRSTLLLEKFKDKLLMYGNTIFVSGILTDKILDILRVQKNIKETIIVVKDFTKIFVSPEAYNSYISKGGKIVVLLKTKLIAVCVNPVSPEGYILDSDKLIEALSENIKLPVYNIKSDQY
ncbi:MAG: hypothetical protein LBQ22_03740 [Bacteroidales bacterium]|jgi:hypothetical protein|nr:hypothetical protein [Bacteroidales bacterium]